MSKASIDNPLAFLMYKNMKEAFPVDPSFRHIMNGERMFMADRHEDGGATLVGHCEAFDVIMTASRNRSTELKTQVEVSIREDTRGLGILALFDADGKRVFHS